ncbi:AsmA family protein [Photobacterium aphoticum]|uniref:Cell envelope biogenesis protein AsmA n=1 Tax=Photobacterium aphoticum TaxID=754436 RepID=A0A0J1JLJ5_9GAMM|nr:AsmA family protein [Photobacterium aphoticum]KLV02972.1 cell envelope biogenesis protein AsmA [Photobacterium aphoticum]PSU57910.1 AsmA family protein [Photobacterium aphoticum]GHA60167.1 cell envelope biogenesis protein AsmA [Photobacterium aphoticum]
MKKILFALLAIVVVIVIGVAALLTLVDPNQFKPLIAEQVKKNTGRELVIEGDIQWRFFPTIGFDIGQTAFRNPTGFAEPNLVQFDSAALSVSVMPLFSQQLEIGNVSLQGGHVFIQTLPNGTSNLDGIGKQADTAEPKNATEPAAAESTATESQPAGDKKPWTLTLQGIEIVDASATVRDDQKGTQMAISALNFSLSRFAPGEWTSATFDVTGKNNGLSFSANGETELLIAKGLDSAQVKALSLNASAQDAKNKIESVNVSVDHFQLGEWASITFSAKGQVPDLAFDATGQTRLQLDQAMNTLSLEGLSLNTDLKGKVLPRPEMALKVAADAQYVMDKQQATLSQVAVNLDELAVTGNASFKAADIPVIRFDLTSDKIDVDAFLGQATAEAKATPVADKSAGNAPAKPVADKNKEPDLSALKTLDVAGKVKVGQFKAGNAKLSDVAMDVQIKRGVLRLNAFDAKLYQGTIHATAQIDANPALPTYLVNKSIKGVQVQPLLKDVAKTDVLAGQGDITVNARGKGLSEMRLRENIAGSIAIHFADGAIYGVNIPEMIREARATLKGKKAEYVKEEKKTDFSAMKATFTLGNGIASTNDLAIESPLLRIAGNGDTNLVSEAIDFTINTSVVATTKGQGGKDVDHVADLTVPIDVKGNWTQPSFSLNVAKLLKQNNELEKKAKKEVERGLEKLLGDKAKDEDIKNAADKLLKGLFN